MPKQTSQNPKNSRVEEPYHFVPVHPELAVSDEPVFHDVQRTSEDAWSGELDCELEALTPLLAGNYQFEYQHAAQAVRDKFARLIQDRDRELGGKKPDDKKKLIETLAVSTAGEAWPDRILIPGSQLKGMIRQSLQALLSAPMERVAERTFSFRPNIDFPPQGQESDVKVMPVVVLGIQQTPKGPEFIVQPLENDPPQAQGPHSVVFLSKDLPREKGEARKPVAPEDLTGTAEENLKTLHDRASVRQIECRRYRFVSKLGTKNGVNVTAENYVFLNYASGIDGRGTFSRAFNGNSGYCSVLARVPQKFNTKDYPAFAVGWQRVQDFFETLHHLRDDESGHLASTHPLHSKLEPKIIQRNIDDMCDPAFWIGYLMYVEARIDAKSSPMKILSLLSLGHHFRYRWRYRDTIHTDLDPQRSDQQAKRPDRERLHNQRAILCPMPHEVPRSGDDLQYPRAPRILSAARCLFGFVGTRGYCAKEPLTFGIGDDDFNQLAGRIAINWAIEDAPPGRTPEQRFLNHAYAGLVPLRPLGSPKASAVETYLAQDRIRIRTDGGTLCTYGDAHDDPAAGELNGRKFYLHQPAARKNPDCYELTGPTHPDWKNASGEGPMILGEQSALARFISTPGTRFRFRLRFRDLRPWEFGALLFVLTADAGILKDFLSQLEPQGVSPLLQEWLKKPAIRAANDDGPALALKLGHGRPLGLGSVRIRICKLSRLVFKPGEGVDADAVTDGEPNISRTQGRLWPSLVGLDDGQFQKVRAGLIASLARKLQEPLANGGSPDVRRWADQVLFAWLQVHQYNGRDRYGYQREGKAIYDYHTQERKKHAKGRKTAKPPKPLSPCGLVPIRELP